MAHLRAHQYLQQPNAIEAAVQDDPFWHVDGYDATTMNLEPNFPCCTGNFNQVWANVQYHSEAIDSAVHMPPHGG